MFGKREPNGEAIYGTKPWRTYGEFAGELIEEDEVHYTRHSQRIHEREFRGQMLPTDMDDNTLMVLDFGDNLFAFVYGTPAGGLPNMGRPMIFGQNGVINGSMLNGERFDYDGRELDEEFGMNGSLPHVVGNHRGVGEEHVYEDVMQLVDYVLDDKPTVATPEHARHVVEIFDAAYRSAEAGKAMDLTTTF